MTDQDLVAKKLARIESCIRELQTLVTSEEIQTDLRAERFAEHTLQMAIQAAQDVASHIVSDDRLGEPRTNRELFEILGRHGWISMPMVDTMRRMVGFRNIVVYGYEIVDPAVVSDIVEFGWAICSNSSTRFARRWTTTASDHYRPRLLVWSQHCCEPASWWLFSRVLEPFCGDWLLFLRGWRLTAKRQTDQDCCSKLACSE